MRRGEANNTVIKIILISLGIAAFISVISTTYSIFQANSPDVLNNCVSKPVVVLARDSYIASKNDALAYLESRMDGEFTFLENTLEVCNPPNTGYVYNSTGDSANNLTGLSVSTPVNKSVNGPANNTIYVVCEDGVLYRYEKTCVEGVKTKSFVSMLFKNKSGE